MAETELAPRLFFSYSQFMVYDQSEQMPGCDWTEDHAAQGFARRESTVCFATLLEFGYAEVTVKFGKCGEDAPYGRIIAVPFRSVSGKVTVEGPEEIDADRVIGVPIGYYKLTAAQTIIGANEERIDLFFEELAEPLENSSIILADELLTPPDPLIETSEIAGL